MEQLTSLAEPSSRFSDVTEKAMVVLSATRCESLRAMLLPRTTRSISHQEMERLLCLAKRPYSEHSLRRQPISVASHPSRLRPALALRKVTLVAVSDEPAMETPSLPGDLRSHGLTQTLLALCSMGSKRSMATAATPRSDPSFPASSFHHSIIPSDCANSAIGSGHAP